MDKPTQASELDLTHEQREALVVLKKALVLVSNVYNARGESVSDLLQMGYCDDNTVNDFCDGVQAMLERES